MTKAIKIRNYVTPQNTFPVTKSSDIKNELTISFKHLDTNNSKYSMDSINDNRKRNKLEKDLKSKLKEYCSYNDFKKKMTSDINFKENNHIHPIDWNDKQIREKCFTNVESDLMEEIKYECWQLGIDNQGFRAHGFFIGNVFYIVWLDPNHQLYLRK